jgi:phytoene dehydrogenase-like protein
MHYDAIIIGAGMSGLAAGIRLAMYDKKVCILEKHYVLGGLNSFYNIKARKFDVGLHAVTNYVAKNAKGAPLTKLLRQLRIPYDELGLRPQNFSEILFPNKQLTFTNDFQHLINDIAEKFPKQIDSFNRVVDFVKSYDNLSLEFIETRTAREILSTYISDNMLIEMLLCPLTYYGSAIENDMAIDQFVTMFKSIFLEGFARPDEGVRKIIDTLKIKYKELGGEIKFRNGVKEIKVKDNKVSEIITEKDESFTADLVISSAGLVETLKLIPDYKIINEAPITGKMSFMESISCLNIEPKELGYLSTITFFNTAENYKYAIPNDFIDTHSGVICCPNNYQLQENLPEGIVRVTNIANYSKWKSLHSTNPEEYYRIKEKLYNESLQEIFKFKSNFKPNIIFSDVFTPHSIERYTGHINGAVYGSPLKRKTGKTDFDNLIICGTDQGFLGIVGALLSGISMANLHGLSQKD